MLDLEGTLFTLRSTPSGYISPTFRTSTKLFYKRPGIEQFLHTLGNYFDIVVY